MVGTGLLTPLVMRVATMVGALDRGGHRKLAVNATPLLGGLAVLAPVLVLCVLGITGGTALLGTIIPETTRQFVVLGIGAVGICALGVLDDIRTLRARVKLVGQVAVAVFVCLTGHHVRGLQLPFMGNLELGQTWGFIISVLWIVGLINAFNLIDGVDGLAAGIALIATVALGVLGASTGNTFIVLNCAVLTGALAAFLGYNSHPARIFLGDTGSMLLGYMLSTVTLMGTYKSQAAAIVAAPLLALGFPIFETFVSILRRFIRGMPLFAGDNRHTHHRLLRAGYSQRQVVAHLYAVAFTMAGATILLEMIPQNKPQWTWLPAVLYAGPLVWIAWVAGYLRPQGLNEAFRRRQRTAVLGAFSRYVVLRMGLSESRADMKNILAMCRREMGLCFLELWYEEGPVLVSSDGAPDKGVGQPGTLDQTEKLRVLTLDGSSLVVQFQFAETPDAQERLEVVHCLGAIFDRIDLPPSPGKVVHMHDHGEKNGTL